MDSTSVIAFYDPGFRYTPSLATTPFVFRSAPQSTVQKHRLAFTLTTLASANYFAYKRFESIWWNYEKSSFHLYRGWRQTEGWYDFGPHDSLWLHMDKLGHFYCTRLLSELLSDTALWIGFDDDASRWLGAVASWLFYLQIEIFDGQFEQWGFSLGDLAANTAGAFMPVLRHHSPFLQKFMLKMSYSPADIQSQQYMIEDYAGMTFWLTTDPQHFLPGFFDHIWPDFLNVAFGYGITQKAHGNVELYFSLDYDLRQLKTRSAFWNRVLHYVNYIHLPAPTLKVTPVLNYNLFYY